MWILERTYRADRTTGVFHAHHALLFETLELPWRENLLRVSCIPEGDYTVLRDRSGRHKWFRILDAEVAPRSAIEFHGASSVGDLLGCVGFLDPATALIVLAAQSPAGERLRITCK